MAALESGSSRDGAPTAEAVAVPMATAEQAKKVIVPPVPLGKRRSSASRLFLRPLTSNRQNAEAGRAEQQQTIGGGRAGLFLSPRGSSQKPPSQNSIFRAFSGESLTLNGRRWTPPLSPSVGKLATPTVLKGENLPGAAEYVAMLKGSGVPPLASATDLKQLVHGAPKAWLRDFKIRGGRMRVNEKLKDMEKIEMQLNRSHFFRRRQQKKQRIQTSVREIVAVREELMQVLLFLHLRE